MTTIIKCEVKTWILWSQRGLRVRPGVQKSDPLSTDDLKFVREMTGGGGGRGFLLTLLRRCRGRCESWRTWRRTSTVPGSTRGELRECRSPSPDDSGPGTTVVRPSRRRPSQSYSRWSVVSLRPVVVVFVNPPKKFTVVLIWTYVSPPGPKSFGYYSVRRHRKLCHRGGRQRVVIRYLCVLIFYPDGSMLTGPTLNPRGFLGVTAQDESRRGSREVGPFVRPCFVLIRRRGLRRVPWRHWESRHLRDRLHGRRTCYRPISVIRLEVVDRDHTPLFTPPTSFLCFSVTP